MEEFETSSQSTDDEHPESNPEIIAIKSKIEETGSKLIILVEDLLKKYSFNENDEWKEEVMRKYAMPGAYMQPSAYLPCHLFREVWSRKKYFKIYFRYPKAKEESDFQYPIDKNSNVDQTAEGPGEDKSNNLGCGRLWWNHQANNTKTTKIGGYTGDVLQLKITACHDCIVEEFKNLNEICETELEPQVLGFDDSDLSKCRCLNEFPRGITNRRKMVAMDFCHEYVELDWKNILVSNNFDVLKDYEYHLDNISRGINFYMEKFNTYLEVLPILGKFEKLVIPDASSSKTEWNLLLTLPIMMQSKVKLKREKLAHVKVCKEMPETDFNDNTLSFEELFTKYSFHPDVQGDAELNKQNELNKRKHDSEMQNSENTKRTSYTAPPVYALSCSFTTKDIISSINARVNSIKIHHLQDYNIHEMNLPSTKNQVLKKLGIHNPKRKKQKKKVNDMLEVGNKYLRMKEEMKSDKTIGTSVEISEETSIKSNDSVVFNLMTTEKSNTGATRESSEYLVNSKTNVDEPTSAGSAKISPPKVSLDPRKRRSVMNSSEPALNVRSSPTPTDNTNQTLISPRTTPLKIIQNKMLPKPVPVQSTKPSNSSPNPSETSNNTYSSPNYAPKTPTYAPRTPVYTPNSPAHSTTYSTNSSTTENNRSSLQNIHFENQLKTQNSEPIPRKNKENIQHQTPQQHRNRSRNTCNIYKMSEILKQQVNNQKGVCIYNQPCDFFLTPSSKKYNDKQDDGRDETRDKIIRDLCNQSF